MDEQQPGDVDGAGAAGSSTAGLTKVEPPKFEARYVTTHKQVCRAARFSPDGMLIATASADTSVKLLDVSKVVQCNNPADGGAEDQGLIKPVIRTFYDHTDSVNDVAFHPTQPIVASCSEDKTVKFYDFSKPIQVKKATQSFEDLEPVRCLAFHPSGNYLLVGTRSPVIRLYDINHHQTSCYTAPAESDNHTAAITRLEYNADGSKFASSSKDGTVKVWDGVTNRCIFTIPKAHGGQAVHSVTWQPHGGDILLTCGKDSVARLWDVSESGGEVRRFIGASQAKRSNNCFSHKGDMVLATDDISGTLVAWDKASGKVLTKTKTDHKNIVRCLAASPVDNCIITGSEDARAKIWTY